MGLFASLMALPGVDAPPDRPTERVHLFRPAHLPETEWFAATDSARMWRVYHEDYKFCVLPPEGNIRESGALYSYRRGDVRCRPHGAYFYEPDTVHANRLIYHAAAFYVFNVPIRVVAEVGRELGLGDRPHYRVPESSSPRVLGVIERLAASLHSPDPLEQQTRLLDMLRVVLGEAGESTAREPRVSSAAVLRAREYVHAYFRERVTLDDLSAVAGVGRYHLVRSFRRVHGLAPHEYLSALRAAHARRQLARGVPPAQIDVGYYDQSHLTRHFVRAYAVTPAAYQRAILA